MKQKQARRLFHLKPHLATLLHPHPPLFFLLLLSLSCVLWKREEVRNRRKKKRKRNKNGWIKIIGPWKLEETVFSTLNFISFSHNKNKKKKRWEGLLFVFFYFLFCFEWQEKRKIFFWAMNFIFFELWTMIHGFGGIWLAEGEAWNFNA